VTLTGLSSNTFIDDLIRLSQIKKDLALPNLNLIFYNYKFLQYDFKYLNQSKLESFDFILLLLVSLFVIKILTPVFNLYVVNRI